MLNFLQKKQNNKEYYSCNWLESGINFYSYAIKICCMCYHKGKGPMPLLKYNGEEFDFNSFFKLKDKIIELHRQDRIYDYCKGCINLVKKRWDDAKHITHINIDNQTACNANCIYCYTSRNKDLFNSRVAYKILPTIKKLINKKILKPGGEVMFGGGEPTVNEEFEEIVNLFLDNDFNYIKVHSSGIKYSKAIERCLSEGKGDIIISPDSGTKELYEQIKRVGCFDQVWSNLKRYVDAQNENKLQVKAKYVIVPQINDSEQNIDDFFNMVKNSSINSVRFDIEMDWYDKNRLNTESLVNLFKLLKYAQEKSKSLNVKQFFFQAQAEIAIDEHSEICKDIFVDI